MSCGCGKKKCNGKCGISPSVLQINNNECTLFHKVEIPAVMGDETTNPPKTGAYRNVLLYYEASGNSYLYSSDGIPTKLTGVVSDYEVLTNKPSINGVVLIKNKTLADLGIISAIDSAVADEATARENVDNALSDRITTNANNITANATAISNEATARTNADNTLSARISGNTTAINNEKTARENADTALSNRITANANAISAETTARENADNALSGRITTNTNAISSEKTARENADAGLQDQITAVKATADSAVQPDDIDKTVMSDLAVDSNSSTAQVILKESKVNLKTGATSSEQTSLPVASSSQAGVMNSATYDAVTSNTSNINAIMNGAVAITGLPANPSQSDLTTAWQNETGLSTLINRASVYDVTNNKVWTYYTNDTTWHAASNTSSVTVNTFTNSSEGTIKGSTNIGQVFAENDGTGSVNGWDALSDAVSNNTSKLAGIESGAEVNVQSDWNVSDSSSDAYIKNKPTIGNGTLTIQKNGTTIDTFTANSTTNKTVNITVPTVNDATLTIQKNGDTVQTFTANSSSNKTANIEVPTKTSELDNDAGFIANDTHQVCGEGGNITLNTTTLEPLEVNHFGGNTEQQTYTGKNLFPCVLASQYPTSSELKVETDANSGTITLTALGTSGSQLGYFNTGELNASSKYTISMQAKKVSGTAGDDKGRFYVRYRTSSDGSTWTGFYDLIQYTPASTGAYYQISGTVSGSKYYQFLFYNYASTPAPVGEKTEYKNIQLVAGSTADYNFEPYVGGTASPNPDYPQAVQTVTGENVVKICGKNLFNTHAVVKGRLDNGVIGYASNTTSLTSTDDSITFTVDAAWRGCISEAIPVKPNTEYHMKAASSGATIGASAADYYSEEGWISRQNVPTAALEYNFTTPANCKYVRISWQTSQVGTVTISNPQLELGSSATEFEVFSSQSYEVNLGKNLLNIQTTPAPETNISQAGITYTIGEDGAITTSGVSTSTYKNLRFDLTLDAGTYFFSGCPEGGTLDTYSFTVQVGSNLYFDYGSGATFTLSERTTIRAYVIRLGGSTGVNMNGKVFKPMIVKGSTPTSFAPYFTPIELCKIGDYQDYIYKSDGKWYVHKEVGISVGSELGWRKGGYQAFSDTTIFYDLTKKAVPIGRAISNYLKYSSNNYDRDDFDSISITSSAEISIRVSNSTATDITAFTDWLDTNRVTIYYVLATPTDTEITNEALIAQLEALWEADGYDSQTNITLTYAEGNAQGILSVCQYPSHLPVATKSKLGTIIVGHGLDIEDDGRLDVIVDSALSESSINPVQNKAITTELNSKADISSVPTKTSQLENDSGFIVSDTTEICDEGSDITLNGTLLEPLDVKKIEGATSQQTYTGKNLLPIDFSDGSGGGLTWKNNGDGTVTVSGTTTTAYAVNISPSSTQNLVLQNGKTYTQRVEVISGNFNLRVVPSFKNGGGTTVYNYFTNNQTKTATDTMTCNAYDLYAPDSGIVANFTIRVWLEEGSDLSSPYEPYVGGVPAPNPDYPQDIKVVTGENVVKICGKNLFDSSKVIVGDIQNANQTIRLHSSQILWLEAGTYTFSTNLPTPLRYSLSTTDKGYPPYAVWPTWDYNSGWQDSERITTFTLTKGGYFNIQLSKPNNATLTLDEFTPYNYQLELGSTATDFEPYQGQSYEVNLGKNLMSSAWETGSYSDSTGEKTSGSTSTRTADYIPVERGSTYIASVDGSGLAMNIYSYDINKNFLGHQFASNGSSFTTGLNTRFITMARSANVDVTKMQLEKGSTITSYAAYFTPIELCKIGDYQDYIYKSGDKWYVRKSIQKFVFKGLETWNSWYVVGDYIGFYHDTPSLAKIGGEYAINGALYCDKLSEVALRTNIRDGLAMGMKQCGGAGFQYIAIGIAKSELSDYSTKENAIASLKTWLANNNLTFYGTLTTPTDTEITNEALIEQLENLWDADGVEGETNIFTVSDGVNERAILSVCQYPSHLPIATKTKLGTVIVGHGLDIEEDGKLDVIIDDDFSTESEHPVQNKVITNALAGKADNTDLSTVAMTGSYDDLTGKPTIPTVNNATLTIQKNGTNVATFTANSSTNVTANITAPVVTMTTTDPGEGGALAANNFIGVYV